VGALTVTIVRCIRSKLHEKHMELSCWVQSDAAFSHVCDQQAQRHAHVEVPASGASPLGHRLQNQRQQRDAERHYQ
jgi:hypothetical protein